MWPWEHAIVGYLAYSLFCHLYYGDSPNGLETFAVCFGSILPDLIDKPLAWEFGLFETGYAIGHSIFFTIPLVIVVGALARSRGYSRAGIAFGIGYVLHLPADVLDGYFRGRGELDFDILLWPLVRGDAPGPQPGFTERVIHLLTRYQHEVLASDLSIYILMQFGVGLLALLVWIYDGTPLLRELLRGCQRLGRRISP